MAKMNLTLLEGETLIGFETVCMQRAIFLFTDTDKLYITNQRICFNNVLNPLNYALNEISCFSAGAMASTTLFTVAGKKHTFTTSSAKKVREWLLQAGVRQG